MHRTLKAASFTRFYYTLSDYPHAMVEIECSKCGRHGRLRTARLLEQYGAELKLPDLLRAIREVPKVWTPLGPYSGNYTISVITAPETAARLVEL